MLRWSPASRRGANHERPERVEKRKGILVIDLRGIQGAGGRCNRLANVSFITPVAQRFLCCFISRETSAWNYRNDRLLGEPDLVQFEVVLLACGWTIRREFADSRMRRGGNHLCGEW